MNRGAYRIGMMTALFFSTAGLAQSAPDVADLVGARAAGGETQLQARGYVFVTVNTVGDTKYTTWWNARQKHCISVATADGRYTAINRIPDANCDDAGYPGDNRGPDDREGRIERPPHHDQGERLTLVCFGTGSGLQNRTYSGYSYNKDRDRFEPDYGSATVRESFSSDVQVEIVDGVGRIHVQGNLVSPIHSGGVDGWWPINGLVVTPDRITGTYRMNGLNKPQLEIDRRSGTIRIKASTDFTGRCDTGNWRSGF